jgi:hypothetical protein
LLKNDMNRNWPNVKDFKDGYTQAFEDLTFTGLSVSSRVEPQRLDRILLTERDSDTVMQLRGKEIELLKSDREGRPRVLNIARMKKDNRVKAKLMEKGGHTGGRQAKRRRRIICCTGRDRDIKMHSLCALLVRKIRKLK